MEPSVETYAWNRSYEEDRALRGFDPMHASIDVGVLKPT
jgi:hypothetical protein